MLTQTEALKTELVGLTALSGKNTLQTWTHFRVCSSGLDRLGAVAALMLEVEQFFAPPALEGEADAHAQPALVRSLCYVRGEVEASLEEFSTWRTEMLSLGHAHKDLPQGFSSEFSDRLDRTINGVLCAVQSLVKRRLGSEEEEPEQTAESKPGSQEEPQEDLLKTGHLTKLLEEELGAEVTSLSLQEVSGSLEQLLESLRAQRETGCPQQIQELGGACRSLVRLQPMLGVYSELVRYYVAVSLGAHRSTGKMLSVLASVFTELAQKGFCLPQELMEGGDGEGATQFHDYEGGGIGEGEGIKDVSDKIENEDQVEDTFQEGQEKKEEEQDKRDVKEEDNAIEMSEDFDGKMHDGDREPGEDDEEESDKEDEELDKKMGDLGEGQTDTLDERMWGDKDDDDDLDGSDREEESGQGMDEGESELVAKDDNLDAGDPNKDDKKRQNKDEEQEETEEKIHEQLDEREFDENEVDPYHGKQDKKPDPEAMDLTEELNLDQENEQAGEEEGEEENPFDIEEKAMELEEKDGGEKEGEEEGVEEMEEDQKDGQGDEQDLDEGKGKEEKGGEEEEEEEQPETEETAEKEEPVEGEQEQGDEAGKEEDKAIPADEGLQPKEEDEEGAGEDEEQPEQAERREHGTDGQTGEENVQSDTAVELAGAASERDQAKEEHGSGAADASQSEGHESKLTARASLPRQSQSKTQSFKRKPGQADNERSTGDRNERVSKRLRTVESGEDRERDRDRADARQESDLYEHIRDGDQAYDTQTYDAASADQQKPAGARQEEDQDEEDDVAMDAQDEEEDLQAVDANELKPEQLDSAKSKQKGLERTELEPQRLGDEDEDEDEERSEGRQDKGEVRPERSWESTVHTVPELLMDTLQPPLRDPEELRKELELQLEAWQRQTPGEPEEESAAAAMWQQYQLLTSPLSQQLCEQLRLILEPTQASQLKGDFRTGKRLNMRKVIPYIASQFRKDKIWLRRTKPSKRNYQICLALDDSSSMIDNRSKQMAFESLSVIVNALTLLEVGQVSVCSFGETVQLLHPFHQQFNDQSGARILRLCQFQQKKTRIAQFLESSANMFVAARHQSYGSSSSETAQLLLIVSDGRGLFLEGKERVTAAVQAARRANVFVIFVVLDNPNSRDSILDIKVPIFKGPGEMPEIRSYMEEFPFPFYIILRNVNTLPETLSDALRQWFELVTATDQ